MKLNYYLPFFLFLIFSNIHAQLLNPYSNGLKVKYKKCENCSGMADSEMNYFYGSSTVFATKDIVSDFGKRRFSTSTDWHKGIDYSAEGGNNDYGDMLLAIEGGYVANIHVTSGYKRISIGGLNNFDYAHIFTDGAVDGTEMRSGDFVLKALDPPLDFEYAIVYDSEPDNPTIKPVAIGSIPLATVTYKGQSLLVQQSISADQELAPMGDSGPTSGAHLHLHRLRNPTDIIRADGSNTWDPLQVIRHQEPTYDILVDLARYGYGTQKSSIKTRVKMKGEKPGNSYNQSVMNVDNVELKIRKSFQADSYFRPIWGTRIESTIKHGAREINKRYPAYSPGGYLDWSSEDLTNVFGSVNVTGIDPSAYRDGEWINEVWTELGFPWDDYYFSDIVFRIHKDHKMHNHTNDSEVNFLAGINEDAKYPDGSYYVRADIATVTGAQQSSEPEPILIDNFKPYIKKVIVTVDSEQGDIIYSSEWVWDDPNLSKIVDNIESDGGRPLFVQITASEPMSALSATLGGRQPLVQNAPSEDQTTFVFQFPALQGSEIGTPQLFEITGTDLNDNELDTQPESIAIKTGSNSWGGGSTNPGTDENFTLNSGEFCSIGGMIANNSKGIPQRGSVKAATAMTTGSCNYVAIDASVTNPQVGEAVIFKAITGDFSGLNWDFGPNAIPGESNQPEVTVVFTDDYTGDVTIRDENDAEQAAKYIDVNGISAPISFTINSNPTSGGVQTHSNITYSIDNLDPSNAQIISYEWDFGQDANYTFTDVTSANPTVNYSDVGSKDVRVTICTSELCRTVTKSSAARVTYLKPILASIVDCPGQNSNSKTVSMQGGPWFGTGDGSSTCSKEFIWDWGDGTFTSSQNQNCLGLEEHEYKAPGTYKITLTICDDSGCDTDDECPPVTISDDEFPFDNIEAFTINGTRLSSSAGGTVPEVVQGNDVFIPAGVDFNLSTSNIIKTGVNPTQTKFVITNRQTGNNLAEFTDQESAVFSPSNPSNGDEYEIAYLVFYGTPGDLTNAVRIFVNVTLDESQAYHCNTKITNLRLDKYCWNDSNPPSFTIDYSSGSCDIGVFEIILDGGVLSSSNNNTGLVWPISKRPNSFPYTRTVQAVIRLDCADSECGILDFGLFEITIDGPREFEIQNQYDICYGASTQIGLTPNPSFSYSWSGNTDFLSRTDIANPVFSGLNMGTYYYDLIISNNLTGCTTEETVSIDVQNGTSAIGVDNQSLITNAGSIITLKAPFEGDGRSYEYEWSPATYLDNPRVPNPVFTAPLVAKNIPQYTVTASFRDCSASGTVDVSVINQPPTNLTTDNSTSGVIHLDWDDNSLEQKFIIQRNADNEGWETIGEVGKDISAFTDAYCLDPDVEYCYRIQAIDVQGAAVWHEGETYSNEACDIVPYELYEIWASTFDKVGVGQSKTGKLFNDGNNDLILVGSEDKNIAQPGYNLAKFLIDKDAGDVSTLMSSYLIHQDKYVHYSSSTENIASASGYIALASYNNYDDNIFFASTDVESFSYKFVPEYMSDQFIINDGSKYFVIGSSTEFNTDHEDDPQNPNFDRQRFPSTVVQEVNQSGSSFFPEEVVRVSNDADCYKDYVQGASALGSSEIVIVSVSEGREERLQSSPYERGFLDIMIVSSSNLSQIAHKTFANHPDQIDRVKLLANFQSSFLVAGNIYDPTDPSDRRIWIRSLWNDVLHPTWITEFWDQEITYGTEELYLDFLIKRGSSPIVVAHTNGSTDNLHIYQLSPQGGIVWEDHLTYQYADKMFDAIFYDEDNLVIGAKTGASRTIDVKKISLHQDLAVPIDICEDVIYGESIGRIGSQIDISENCEANFESESSSYFEATESLTFHPGTWIKPGAYFTARASSTIDIGDCSDFGLPVTRIALDETSEDWETSFDRDAFLVYPNPSSREFQIELRFEEKQSVELALYDLNGRLVWSDRGTGWYYMQTVSTEELSSGLHLLRIQTSNGTSKTLRVLIRKGW